MEEGGVDWKDDNKRSMSKKKTLKVKKLRDKKNMVVR